MNNKIMRFKTTNEVKMQKKKNLFIQMMLLVSIVFSFNVGLPAKIVANFSPLAFTPRNSDALDEYVVKAAGSFLKSQSEYFLFLNRIEMEDVCIVRYLELLGLINTSLIDMKDAKKEYENLVQLAETSSYNDQVILELKYFDYVAFQMDRGLDTDVFTKVEKYLKIGDVRGFYTYLYDNVVDIVQRLQDIRADVLMNKTPELSELWRLNQLLFQTHLFGQYGAEVFAEISGI